MGNRALQWNQEATREIVCAGLIAAAYAVLTMALAPVSFGPLQMRVATLLVPVFLLDRRYALGVALGVALGNLLSPFGWYDWAIMPLVSYASYMAAWQVRRYPWAALLVSACIVAAGVAYLPLHLGGGIPFWPTVVAVFVPQLALYLAGWYGIWRKLQGTI